MPIRLAIIVSHPIPHFAPWHRELARISDIDLKVFFCFMSFFRLRRDQSAVDSGK